jgi:hypothetical protein
LSRLAALAVLIAGLALATCGYAPMPPSGQQMCAAGTGKQCPDGYHCSADRCILDGVGGAGGGLNGAAGKGGAGGHAGAGGAGQAGASGATGTGGAGGAPVLPTCTASAAGTWSGSLSMIGSGAIAGPTPTPTSDGLRIIGSSLGPGPAAVGAAFTFNPCVDAQASGYTGVSFSISGSVSSSACTPLFQMDDSERLATGMPGPAISIPNLSTTTAQTIQVPWTTGSATGPLDDQHVAIFVWGVEIATGATCSINYSITNLTFY